MVVCLGLAEVAIDAASGNGDAGEHGGVAADHDEFDLVAGEHLKNPLRIERGPLRQHGRPVGSRVLGGLGGQSGEAAAA